MPASWKPADSSKAVSAMLAQYRSMSSADQLNACCGKTAAALHSSLRKQASTAHRGPKKASK